MNKTRKKSKRIILNFVASPYEAAMIRKIMAEIRRTDVSGRTVTRSRAIREALYFTMFRLPEFSSRFKAMSNADAD